MNLNRPQCNASAIIFTLAVALVGLTSFAATSSAVPAQDQQPSAPEQPAPPAPKTAGEVFKNLKILKDIPADELFPSMRYISAALGVRCDYCHDPDHFDSDCKPEKETARKMMNMMFAINTENFKGHREVTCFTCHHGSPKAASTPALFGATPPSQVGPAGSAPAGHEPAGESPAAAASLPSINAILERFAQAVGSPDARSKITTRIEKGTVDIPARGVHNAIETYRKAPDKAFATQHTPGGDVTEGFNGTAGWQQRPDGKITEVNGDELARTKQWASFYLGQNLKQEYSRLRVNGIDRIDGREVFRVQAWRGERRPDLLYFDAQSGLVMRTFHLIESPLGALPLQTDFDDYRDVQGVKIPFTVRVTRADSIAIYKWDQIDVNVPIDDARFEQPPAKAAPKP